MDTLLNAIAIVGFIVTVLGFWITIKTLMRTKTAAESARTAAEQTKEQVSRVNTITEFASAIAIMDEIKRLHRARAWYIVPDRYSALRQLLASIQIQNPDLTAEHKSILAGAIVQFRTMENVVETACLANPPREIDLPRLNKTVSKVLDNLNAVMTAIQQAGI